MQTLKERMDTFTLKLRTLKKSLKKEKRQSTNKDKDHPFNRYY